MAVKPTEIFRVRDRPVGYVAGPWGGAFVAVERGYFPVSETGYRSCTGFVGRPDVGAAEKQLVLEKVAEEQDRARAASLKDLAEAARLVGDPVVNFIQASSAYERAVVQGFFATDRQRSDLWSGAHRLLCLVTENQAFQPAVEAGYPAWTAEHCGKALEFARELRRLLGRWAAGDLSEGPPLRMLGTHAYFDLPAKPDGEPKIELGAYTAELALQGSNQMPRSRKRVESGKASVPMTYATTEMQLGLFEDHSSASVVQRPSLAP